LIGETQKTIIAVVLAILFVGVIAEVSLRMFPAQEILGVPTSIPVQTSSQVLEPAPRHPDPAFPSWIFFPILIVSTIAVIVIIRNKIRKKGIE
jgi:hypothetical protein